MNAGVKTWSEEGEKAREECAATASSRRDTGKLCIFTTICQISEICDLMDFSGGDHIDDNTSWSSTRTAEALGSD